MGERPCAVRTSIAAVILAGGKSSRMGSDKALLTISGKRLLDVVAGVIRQSGITSVFVSGAYGGYDCISDETPHKGPVGGICSAIQRLAGKYDSLLFIPVDMPCISKDLITGLAEQTGEACCYGGNPLPCKLTLDHKTQDTVSRISQQIMAGEKVSVKQLLQQTGVTLLPVSGTLLPAITNTNTPEEWKETIYEHTHQ